MSVSTVTGHSPKDKETDGEPHSNLSGLLSDPWSSDLTHHHTIASRLRQHCAVFCHIDRLDEEVSRGQKRCGKIRVSKAPLLFIMWSAISPYHSALVHTDVEWAPLGLASAPRQCSGAEARSTRMGGESRYESRRLVRKPIIFHTPGFRVGLAGARADKELNRPVCSDTSRSLHW
jgi:hypothetical protein